MYRNRSSQYDRVLAKVTSFLQKKGIFSRTPNREQWLLLFFWFLVIILILRLFYLQVFAWWYYRDQLSQQHSSKVDIVPKRWTIFVYDDAGQSIPLATNADIYTMFADPKFIWDTQRVVEVLTPQLYIHFCELYWLKKVDKETCIKNIEDFTKTLILPRPKIIYYSLNDWWSGLSLSSWVAQAQVGVEQANQEIALQKQAILDTFTSEEAISRINARLTDMLTPWKKAKNYIWFFDSPALLAALSGSNIPYLSIDNQYYLYITPDSSIRNTEKEAQKISDLLTSYWYNYTADRIKPLFSQQDTRYVKITEGMNATIAQKLITAKNENYWIKSTCSPWDTNCEWWVPLLHAIWLEKNNKRYYPLWSFAANVLWYITPQGESLYGIEQYYDTLLKGTPWYIRWLSTPWIWEIGSNDVSIINPIDWWDVYLTINPFLQKKTENLVSHYVKEFNADSIAILIMDPYSGSVVASANAPTFDPNDPQESYALKPLTPEDAYIVDDDSRIDVPVYYVSGNALKNANYDDRKNPALNKYVAKNLLGAQVFVDKNIAFPYEPGSIIKPFTVAAWLDNDEISLYDFYSDPNSQVKIDLWNGEAQFIRNADKANCAGTKTFLHALIYSCNVGMVKIAQQIKKEAFFNYMERFGFGIPTSIELAWEDPGFLDTAANAWLARFFNNAFGQGMLATPIQIAAAYSSLVNWWYYVKPRIIDKIYDPETKTFIPQPVKLWAQILKPETSAKIRDALFDVIYGWLTKKFGIPWYTLWGKTGTSQISFKWVYRSGNGWTNASFAGIVTKENLKYVVVIQVRRPRTNQYWEYTAGKIFGDLAKILIEKDLITK